MLGADHPYDEAIDVGPARGGVWAAVRSPWPPAPAAVFLVGVALLLGALAWPLVFAGPWFIGDGPNHAWLIWHQSVALGDAHWPTYFLNYSNGIVDQVLYPEYAFYGGTLFTLAGAISLALGKAPETTFVLAYLLGFIAASGGWYWMARMAGLGRWVAHVPGVIFITSAYYLTLIYARGDWPEFLGVSMIPLMCAAGLSIFYADRLRFWPGAAFALSGVVFFGSHTLTVLWGSTLLTLVVLVSIALVPGVRHQIKRSGLIRVAGLLVLALLCSGWMLLPALANEASTFISRQYDWAAELRSSVHYVSSGKLFTLSRASDTTPGAQFALSLPLAAIVWIGLSSGIVLSAKPRGPWLAILSIMVGLATGVLILLTHPGLILKLPGPYTRLQYTYRLESYALLGIGGAVLALLVLLKGNQLWATGWRWTLVPVLCVALVGAMLQAHTASLDKRGPSPLKTFYEVPFRGEELVDYVDADLPFISTPHLSKIDVSPASVKNDRVAIVVHLIPGQLVNTNIEASSNFVSVRGARIVGVSPDGDDVLRIGSAASVQRDSQGRRSLSERISLEPAQTFPIVAGRVLSICGILGLLLALSFPLFRYLVGKGPSASVSSKPSISLSSR